MTTFLGTRSGAHILDSTKPRTTPPSFQSARCGPVIPPFEYALPMVERLPFRRVMLVLSDETNPLAWHPGVEVVARTYGLKLPGLLRATATCA